MNYDYI